MKRFLVAASVAGALVLTPTASAEASSTVQRNGDVVCISVPFMKWGICLPDKPLV